VPTAPPAPLVIAHRGASGYLPEHTLPAKALAYGQGADFIEQDVVATRDDELIVLHDIHLDTVSDVADRFPDRCRDDGRWYARDFLLSEVRTLRLYERAQRDGGAAVYPGRFPHRAGRFSIATLAEEIEMIQGMNRAGAGQVGIYPEIKRPAWHHSEGVDVAAGMLRILRDYGYEQRSDRVYLQCFDPVEARRLREQLGTELRIVQLLAENSWGESSADYVYLQSAEGLAEISEYADGIGPWLPQLYKMVDGMPQASGLAERAHDQGLTVHAYTLRADDLPSGFSDYAALVSWCASTLAIGGLFTDFPDRTLQALGRFYTPE